MLRVVPLESSHLERFIVHPRQGRYQCMVDEQKFSTGWAALDGTDVIAVSGVVEMDGMVLPWLLFSNRMKPAYMVRIFRLARRVLAEWKAMGLTVRADIDPGYPEAIKMARMFGFMGGGPVRLPDDRMLWRMEQSTTN